MSETASPTATDPIAGIGDALSDDTYPTTCWECSTNCGALATVKDGKVVQYAPNPDNPHSKGGLH